MIRVKGAKEINPKFLPTAIMFEGLKPITRKFDYKTQKTSLNKADELVHFFL